MASLFKKYQKEVRQLFEWSEILEKAKMHSLDKGNGYIYIDTIFSLMPSGKSYLPKEFDNYELCPRCHGTKKTQNNDKNCKLCSGLGSHEAYKDQEYWRALECVADVYGLWIARGEEDPYCVFAGMKLHSE